MTAQDLASLLAEGENRLAAGDWDGAVAVFRQAVEAAPLSALAHSKLGVAYAYRRQWEDARAEFTRAIQLDPRYAPAHSNLGNVHREHGRLDDAVTCYLQAIRVDPDYWIAHQNLGIVYKQQGRFEDAVREFKVSTRLSLRAKRPAGMEAGGSSGQTAPGTGARFGCLGAGTAAMLSAALVCATLLLSLRGTL